MPLYNIGRVYTFTLRAFLTTKRRNEILAGGPPRHLIHLMKTPQKPKLLDISLRNEDRNRTFRFVTTITIPDSKASDGKFI